MKTIRPFGVALLAAAISTPALAEDDIQTVYLNPFAGYQYFGDKRDLDEEATYGFGLEYRFLPQWAVEAVYSRSEPDRKYTSGDVDFEEMRVDGLYYFGSQSDKLNPYLAAGVGHADFDGGTVTTPGTEHDETRVNLGGGLRYNVTDLVSLRGDVRAFHGIDESTSMPRSVPASAWPSAVVPASPSRHRNLLPHVSQSRMQTVTVYLITGMNARTP